MTPVEYPLTQEAVDTAKSSDAVLMGSIGGDAQDLSMVSAGGLPRDQRQDF